MEYRIIKLIIERNESEETVKLIVAELSNLEVTLTNSRTEDLEKLFNEIFDEIISTKQMIEFQLDDEKKDLFHEVVVDIVLSLNTEIKSSEDNFVDIIKLQAESEVE